MQVLRVQNDNCSSSFRTKKISKIATCKSLKSIRKQRVEDYLAKRGPRDVLNRANDPYEEVSVQIPLGVQVKKLGDDISTIDQKYGLHGLYTYVDLADKKPEKTLTAAMWLDKLLLSKCQNGGSVSLREIYERLGDYGMDLYESYIYKFIVETFGLSCRISKNNLEQLRNEAIVRRLLYTE